MRTVSTRVLSVTPDAFRVSSRDSRFSGQDTDDGSGLEALAIYSISPRSSPMSPLEQGSIRALEASPTLPPQAALEERYVDMQCNLDRELVALARATLPRTWRGESPDGISCLADLRASPRKVGPLRPTPRAEAWLRSGPDKGREAPPRTAPASFSSRRAQGVLADLRERPRTSRDVRQRAPVSLQDPGSRELTAEQLQAPTRRPLGGPEAGGAQERGGLEGAGGRLSGTRSDTPRRMPVDENDASAPAPSRWESLVRETNNGLMGGTCFLSPHARKAAPPKLYRKQASGASGTRCSPLILRT